MSKFHDTSCTFLLGGASVTCAETLRQNGFQGRLVIATKEKCLPYDRPKLSKVGMTTCKHFSS